MKVFYSTLDIGCSILVTQAIQHLVIGDMASRLGGKITFYCSEDPATLDTQATLKTKLDQHPEVDGFIFFRLRQFGYGPTFDYPLLRRILQNGYSVHFARERLSLTDEAALNANFATLYLADYTMSRDMEKNLL